MFEESSFSEVRRVSEELARERAWQHTPLAEAFAALAAQAFDLAHATEAWATRAAESWIATDTNELPAEVLRSLFAQVAAVAAVVNADLN